MVCGNNGSPGRSTLLLFANTDLAVALHGMTVVQPCPVLARSMMSLDIPGIWVFIASEKG